VHFVPTHLHPAYKEFRTELLPVTERLWKTLVTLPLFPTLSDDEIAQVIEGVKSFSEQIPASHATGVGVAAGT
jgi:dTDP-4-amino-4,6-dideoxygalactose transaminase